MKKQIPFIIFCILTLVWVGVIFANSAKPGVQSGAASWAVVELIEDIFQRLGIEIDVSERFIRKLAHFLEYMLLSLLISADIFLIIPREKLTYNRYPIFTLAPALGFIVANVDEFCVQAATVGRGPSFKDVCIDTSGAFTGAIAFVFVIFIVSEIRKKRKVS